MSLDACILFAGMGICYFLGFLLGSVKATND